MKLLDLEREARDSNTLLLGVSHMGHEFITGSIISCAVMLDYKALTPKLIEKTLTGVFDKEVSEDVRKALKVFNICKLDSLQLNSISDTTLAVHYADFHAVYRCIFNVFEKFSADPDTVLSDTPIHEVVKNQDLSLYKDKDSKSSYVLMKDWNQFDNLIPNTEFSVTKSPEVFTILFAKAFANTMLAAEIQEQSEKYPEYNFGISHLSDSQKELLKKEGLTEFHRAYLPELAPYAFSKHILI